jgi:hypothetical protein
MTNWKTAGRAVDPPVREEDLNGIVPKLEKLEGAFQPHRAEIPVDGLMWNGPEDVE